ncbi:hypothetical protein, partial [Nocardiopsis sp. NPDC006832]|uniref:hypothetical protein n=1 Tax=Nocardiopsis sp. NPDC006832 TaxID=3157188 RepID=UPI0033C5EBAC
MVCPGAFSLDDKPGSLSLKADAPAPDGSNIGEKNAGPGALSTPTDSSLVPRFAGPATFARLPRIDQVERADIA